MRNKRTKKSQQSENKFDVVGHYVIQHLSSPFLFFMHIFSAIK